MNYRTAVLWPRTQYTADKVETVDIDIVDPISRIVITAEPDNNPTAVNTTAHPAKCITKIELVDGSDVLFSLTGQEAQAVDFYDEGIVRPNIMSYLSGNYAEMIFNLNFGRFLFDPIYAFDPTKFKNPQLKITLDIDGGADESNDVYLTVVAHAFDEKVISPLGFLMAKEIKQFTLANSAYEYTDLPTDYPYRQLFLRAQRYGTGPESQISTVKLSENMDKKIPFDLTMAQILRNMQQFWPPYDEWILKGAASTTGEYLYNTPCYWPMFTTTQWRAAATTYGIACYSGDGGRFTLSMSTVGPNAGIFCKGWAPHAVIPLLPRPDIEVADWYQVQAIKNLKLHVKGAADVGTSQTAEIIVQQLRGY